MTEEQKAVIFTLLMQEMYRNEKKMSSYEVADKFKKNNVYNFIMEHYHEMDILGEVSQLTIIDNLVDRGVCNA